MKKIRKKYWGILLGLGLLLIILVWLNTTDDTRIWPVRNTVQYNLLTQWWRITGEPTSNAPGTLQGTVKNRQGTPISDAWVLVTEWDGTTYSRRTNQAGHYTIAQIPAQSYRPVAGAPGYEDIVLGTTKINANTTTMADIILPPVKARPVSEGQNLTFSAPATLTCTTPLTATAVRQEVKFESGGQQNQPTFFYTPVSPATDRLPILLVVYPGPANTWDCASIPLASAGYGVLAVGPAYTFELENDIDELQRLIMFARAGEFARTDSEKIVLLGGSYSSIHVQRLLQRDKKFAAALLLGPPTDLFDMRRRLEDGSYIPPFNLDKALIALGLPSQEPLRYWRYSGAYHVDPHFPPIAILHSRSDDVVPYQQSELLAKNLAAVGAPHETYYFDGASHYLLAEEGDKDSLKIYEIALTFLDKQIK